MAGRPRAELNRIRATNRAAMGMADAAPSGYSCPGANGNGMGACCASCERTGGMCVGRAPLPLPAPGMGDALPGPFGQYARAIPGMGASFPIGLIPPVRVGSAFPAVDYTWDPRQPGVPPSGESSPVGEWLNRHVLRPFVEMGPVRYAPGDGYEDYSGLARVLTYLVGTFGAATGAYILYRAFGRSA